MQSNNQLYEEFHFAHQGEVFEPTIEYQNILSNILDEGQPFDHSIFERYRSNFDYGINECRKTIFTRQRYEYVLLGNLSRYHKNQCDYHGDGYMHDWDCWSGTNVLNSHLLPQHFSDLRGCLG